MRLSLKRALWVLFVIATFVFLMSPILVLIFSAFDDGKFFRFPPRMLSLRWFEAAFASAEYQRSLFNSTILGLIATATSLPLGTMAAITIVRSNINRKVVFELLLLAPLTLPLIVWAIALLQIYARVGISGSLGGLVLAHATITLPYIVRIMIATLSQIDPNLEAAAKSLGATPLTAFARITLPIALPGLLTSAAFSFLVSFNDVIVSTFVAGSSWITFPVRLYSQLRGQGIDPITLAIGAMIIGSILVVVLIGELSFKWSRRV
jgi:putative spermidine/putrescine transport system permease protein